MQSEITTNRITEFLSLYDCSIETMKKAGRLLLEMLIDDPQACEKIKAASGGRCTDATLHLFVRIGQGTLMPELLTASCPAYKRLRSLPSAVQKDLLATGTAPLLLNSAVTSLIRIRLTDMNPAQVKQCFDRVGLRNNDEQRAWLLQNEGAPPATREDGKPYRITKDAVHFTPCKLSVRQLAAILAEATP